MNGDKRIRGFEEKYLKSVEKLDESAIINSNVRLSAAQNNEECEYMIYAIAYGNDVFAKSRDYNLKTAVKKGKADKTIAYSPKDIDESFAEQNKDILSQRRGNGYWLWKPYFILKTLNQIEDGDYLMYADSGAVYQNPIQTLIDCMEQNGQNILCFYIGSTEKYWSKRDAFILLDCDKPEYTDTSQRLGGFVLCKNCEQTRAIVAEWLGFCTDRRIITDDENTLGLPNYDGFQGNRHDQTCWSLITKKHGIPAFRDPSQFGEKTVLPEEIKRLSTYPTIFFLHRTPDMSNGFKLFLHKIKSRIFVGRGFLAPFLKIYYNLKNR